MRRDFAQFPDGRKRNFDEASVCLLCGAERVRVHRFAVESSAYITRKLESGEKVITVADRDPDSLGDVLYIMYTMTYATRGRHESLETPAVRAIIETMNALEVTEWVYKVFDAYLRSTHARYDLGALLSFVDDPRRFPKIRPLALRTLFASGDLELIGSTFDGSFYALTRLRKESILDLATTTVCANHCEDFRAPWFREAVQARLPFVRPLFYRKERVVNETVFDSSSTTPLSFDIDSVSCVFQLISRVLFLTTRSGHTWLMTGEITVIEHDGQKREEHIHQRTVNTWSKLFILPPEAGRRGARMKINLSGKLLSCHF